MFRIVFFSLPFLSIQCSQAQQISHQMHSQPIVSSSMHIQPTNQSYANQNQTIASNVAVPYSIATHDTNVMQQGSSQMNSVNQSNVNLQSNYVNSTIPTQQTQATTIMQQQTQPVLVQPIQATQQTNVVNNPNRTNVISSDAGESIVLKPISHSNFSHPFLFSLFVGNDDKEPNKK